MNKRKQSAKTQTQTKRRGGDPIPWKYCLLTLCCGLLLVVGFFFAARSHFSSIDFGIKNSRLRKQIDELEGDKRRLILSKEIALSPAEIKKAAKKIGLTEMNASNIEIYRPNPNAVKEKPKVIEKPKLEFLSKPEEVKKEEKKIEVKPEKKAPDAKEKPERTKVQLARK